MNFRIGEVSFNPTTRALTDKNGRPAQLRNKSKEVLRLLVENPGHTITKSEILDTVWSDVTVSDESLVQCIADIRRVVGSDARQILETVPREGYRINLHADAPPRRQLMMASIIAIAAVLVAVWSFWPARTAPPKAQVAQTQGQVTPLGTDNTEAYLEVLKGSISANRFSSSESLIAERHFRRAIALDPAYARAYAELGTLFAVRFENGWTVLENVDKEKALAFADKAVDLDPDLWLAHYALGRLHGVFSNFDLAEAHLERAMSLQPADEDARAFYGVVRHLQGDAEGAIAILEPAVMSHPNPPYWYFLALGHALFSIDQYEGAESALQKCLDLAKNSPYCLRFLIAVYGETGQVAEAEAAARTYESMGFDPSIGSIMSLMQFHRPDDRSRLEIALRLAGLPE